MKTLKNAAGFEKAIIFGSLRPYNKMEGKLVRAVWACEKTESGWSEPSNLGGYYVHYTRN